MQFEQFWSGVLLAGQHHYSVANLKIKTKQRPNADKYMLAVNANKSIIIFDTKLLNHLFVLYYRKDGD